MSEEPEETEHLRIAEVFASVRVVWFTLDVTFETISVQDDEDQTVYYFEKTMKHSSHI